MKVSVQCCAYLWIIGLAQRDFGLCAHRGQRRADMMCGLGNEGFGASQCRAQARDKAVQCGNKGKNLAWRWVRDRAQVLRAASFNGARKAAQRTQDLRPGTHPTPRPRPPRPRCATGLVDRIASPASWLISSTREHCPVRSVRHQGESSVSARWHSPFRSGRAALPGSPGGAV